MPACNIKSASDTRLTTSTQQDLLGGCATDCPAPIDSIEMHVQQIGTSVAWPRVVCCSLSRHNEWASASHDAEDVCCLPCSCRVCVITVTRLTLISSWIVFDFQVVHHLVCVQFSNQHSLPNIFYFRVNTSNYCFSILTFIRLFAICWK